MKKQSKKTSLSKKESSFSGYDVILSEIIDLLESARRASVRTVNTLMTTTYWEIGRRIVEFEQSGKKRAAYAEALLENLSADLVAKFGRGFSRQNLQQMRQFYTVYSPEKIRQTLSGKLGQGEIEDTTNSLRVPKLKDLAGTFPLSWSHYVTLLSVKNPNGRAFYETEALRGGWSVRQLSRQINTMFYERTALSRNKAAMLIKGAKPKPEDVITPEEEIKDPFVLEFLNLKDEYSESELEEALINHLESFLLELGEDFAFVGRQKRLRIGDQWFRVDLLFFHRRLRCLIVIELKIGRFTHADAGQMHMYLNYAREHWTHADENPPVGLILCAEKDAAVAHYALEGLANKVLAAEYRMTLPDEKTIAAELAHTRKTLEEHKVIKRMEKKAKDKPQKG
jgi:predicted nuclease of restriction endonuclease-like (RecB) superfamily